MKNQMSFSPEVRERAARLADKGVASYAPVASNKNSASQARNRRVELVEQ